VIGVVEDAVYRSAREGAPPTAYFPSAPRFGNLSIRSAIGEPDRLTSRVIDTITREDPDVQISASPMSDYARATVAAERVTAMLAGFFGVLALVLAAVGTYGVMAYSVSRRRTELAIRRALGATGVEITRLVVGRSVRIAAAGIGLGTIISLQMSGLVAPLLYGATATDPVTFAGAAVVLLSVALAAAWLPARRAARVNPASLLRES
jgi:ABC-type antimicrobial peptide transport system permease subunit